MRKSREFFICQQGFDVPNDNPHLYAALMLQPRIIFGLVVIGTILQRAEIFMLLSAVLAWGTLFPRQNLFDAVYNYTFAFPRGVPPLDAAPAPRRFAQAAAATIALLVGLALVAGTTWTAWGLEIIFIVAAASAVVRRFCLPAQLYYVLRRKVSPIFGLEGGTSQPCWEAVR